MPKISAISSCLKPSTSCSTKILRASGGSLSIASERSSLAEPPCSTAAAALPFYILRAKNHVGCQPVQPGGEWALAPELGQLLPRSHKNIFRQLCPSRGASRQSSAQRVYAAEVPPVQPLERLVVPLRRECRVVRITHQLRDCRRQLPARSIIVPSPADSIAMGARFEPALKGAATFQYYCGRDRHHLTWDCHEEKERNSRLLEKEAEGTAAGSRCARHHEGTAAPTATAGEIRKAACDVDEIGTARIVASLTRYPARSTIPRRD